MTPRRPRIEDLAGLAALPPDDPRRREAGADPRTAALLRAYQEFVAPGPLPEGARLDEAEDRLLAALEEELGVALESPRPAPGEVPAPARGPGLLRRALANLAAPALRPALAVAVLLVVAALAWWQVSPRPPARAPLLRGPAAPSAPGAWEARPEASSRGPGRTRLAWNPAPGATEYEVVFLAGNLTEIARVTGLTAPGLTLARGTLPAGLVSGQDVLWRVRALAGRDEIARSDPSPVRVP